MPRIDAHQQTFREVCIFLVKARLSCHASMLHKDSPCISIIFPAPIRCTIFQRHFCVPCTEIKVKIALGAVLVGADTPKDLANPGLAVFCMPGGFWERDENASGYTELKKWANELEFLSAVVALLKEEIVLPALGGTAYRNPGIRVKRVLKGFGGCRSIQQLAHGKIKLLEIC
jgi:hypothetical protein